LSRLGYRNPTLAQQLTIFCQQYPYQLDGGSVYTLDFIETFLQTLLQISDHEEEESLPMIHRTNLTSSATSSSSSSVPFPWPLVDMAEYEFGSFGIENEVDMK
jgi:hypothetical protein